MIERLRHVFLLGLGAVLLSGCVQLGMRFASLKVDPPEGLPEIKATTLAEWETEADTLRETFAEVMYGTWPEGLKVTIGETRVVDENYLGGLGTLEETVIGLGEPDENGVVRSFHLAVAYPKSAREGQSVPVIIGQAFSENCLTFQSTKLTAPNGQPCEQTKFTGFTGWMVQNILGRYIANTPVDQYLERGYAYANYYASSIVPDGAQGGAIVMERFRENNPGITASSALSYWGYGWSASIDMFEDDPRIDQERVGIFGHSRHGKSALVAAAWDERIDLVISHQSGFGGGSMNRSKAGERLDRVVKSYPHWFKPSFAEYADAPETLPVEQHQLLALIAPRPLLLGNGRRDVWSDPNSSYEAAYLADAVWELYGSGGLEQDGLKDFNPAADLSFSMRHGAHGITPEDVEMFFAFLDAHFVED